MEKFETPENVEQTPTESGKNIEPNFWHEEFVPVTTEHHEEQVAEIEAEIDATLRAGERVSSEIPPETPSAVPPRSETLSESTFLDRHPSLSKILRRVMLVAGLGVSGSVLAQDDITVHQQVGGGQAVPVWSGNATAAGETTFAAPKAKSSQHAQKGGDSSASAKKAAQNNGNQTVTVNGRVVSSGENISGVTLKENTVIVDGKAIPLDGGRIEVNQKSETITGPMIGVQIK